MCALGGYASDILSFKIWPIYHLWVWVNKFVLKTIIALNVTSLLYLLELAIKHAVFFIYDSPEDIDLHQILQGILDPDGHVFGAFIRDWLKQFPSYLPVSGFVALVRTLALYFFWKSASHSSFFLAWRSFSPSAISSLNFSRATSFPFSPVHTISTW